MREEGMCLLDDFFMLIGLRVLLVIKLVMLLNIGVDFGGGVV